MGLSLIALGVYFYIKFEVESSSNNVNPYLSEDLVKDLAFVPLVALLAFIAAFSIGFGPLPWVMNSELFSKEAKVNIYSINMLWKIVSGSCLCFLCLFQLAVLFPGG